MRMQVRFGKSSSLKERIAELKRVCEFYSEAHGYKTIGALIKKGYEPITDFNDNNIMFADGCEFIITGIAHKQQKP